MPAPPAATRTRSRKEDGGPINAVERGSTPPPARAKHPLVEIPDGWRKASEVLDTVSAVPTVFADFNRKVRVGGIPLRRIHTIFGPSHGGKSAFALGLLKSFVVRGHLAAYVDAEHATPQEFAAELLGELNRYDNFLADRPKTYESAIKNVGSFLRSAAEQRRRVLKDTGVDSFACVMLIDTINKLTPGTELEQILRDAENIDKGWGRRRANINNAFLDHVVPLLGDANCAMVLIAQERQDQSSGAGGFKALRSEGVDLDGAKVKGGGGLVYDASLLMRVSKGIPMKDPPTKEGTIVGFRHYVRILKSKVAHMDGRWTDSMFHLSNGKLSPPGFDVARDLVTVGKDLGVVATSGSWLSWRRRRWQGEGKAIATLSTDAAALGELEAEVSAAIEREAGRT